MYYVIQHYRDDPKRHFISYKVPKYITGEKSENVIFEFKVDGKIKRKWAPKCDIILLTDNETLFNKLIGKLERVREEHLERIKTAEHNLQKAFRNLESSMRQEFDDIELRKSTYGSLL